MSFTPEEIRELELLDQGIHTVKVYEFDKVLKLCVNLATFANKAFGVDKKLSKDDFQKFQSSWDSIFEVRDSWKDIKKEFDKLGIVGKVTLFIRVVKTYKEVSSLLKVLKK